MSVDESILKGKHILAVDDKENVIEAIIDVCSYFS
jgi:hypothetical protein